MTCLKWTTLLRKGAIYRCQSPCNRSDLLQRTLTTSELQGNINTPNDAPPHSHLTPDVTPPPNSTATTHTHYGTDISEGAFVPLLSLALLRNQFRRRCSLPSRSAAAAHDERIFAQAKSIHSYGYNETENNPIFQWRAVIVLQRTIRVGGLTAIDLTGNLSRESRRCAQPSDKSGCEGFGKRPARETGHQQDLRAWCDEIAALEQHTGGFSIYLDHTQRLYAS